MVRPCTVEARKAQRGFHSFSFFFLSAYSNGHVCTSLGVFVSAQGTEKHEKKKKETTCQPNVNFEDAWTAGGGETKRGSEGSRKNCDCKTHFVIVGRACVKTLKIHFLFKTKQICFLCHTLTQVLHIKDVLTSGLVRLQAHLCGSERA